MTQDGSDDTDFREGLSVKDACDLATAIGPLFELLIITGRIVRSVI